MSFNIKINRVDYNKFSLEMVNDNTGLVLDDKYITLVKKFGNLISSEELYKFANSMDTVCKKRVFYKYILDNLSERLYGINSFKDTMNVFIDLETLGVTPYEGSPIMSISSAIWHGGRFDSCFHYPINLESQSYKTDPNTMNWWNSQSKYLVDAILHPDEDYELDYAIQKYEDDIIKSFLLSGCKSINIWGNSNTFDNDMIKNHLLRTGQMPIFDYWMDRDVRTLNSLSLCNKINEAKEFAIDHMDDIPVRARVKHHSLYDALFEGYIIIDTLYTMSVKMK